MVKILFAFNGLLAKGGTEAVMLNIYNNIDKSKFKIDFMFVGEEEDDFSDYSKYLKQTGAKLYYVTIRAKNYRKYLSDIKEIIKNNDYDIVHSHMDASGVEFLKIARKYNIPVRVAHSHNTNHLSNPRNLKEIVHKLFLEIERMKIRSYATHYIACSTEAGEWLFGRKRCQGKNYLLFKNAIDVSKYAFSDEIREIKRQELGLDNKKVIGHMGRFAHQKNHEYLIEIFKKIHEKDEDTVLVLIGEGELMHSVQEIVGNYGLTDVVYFLGSRSDVSELLQVFDIFVFPSRYEGLSVALIEAQASGLECVTSDSISPESKVTNLVHMLNLNESPEEWANTILKLLYSSNNRSFAGDILIEKGYDMKSNVENIEEFYLMSLNDK